MLGLTAVAGLPALHREVSIGAVTAALVIGIPIMRRGRALLGILRLILPVTGLVFLISVASLDVPTAALACLRLLNLLIAASMFFQLVTPEELAGGLRQWKVPYPLVFILTTSRRYVPLLSCRIKTIMEAQRSRGIDMRWRLRNLKNLKALVLPLLVQSFLLAEQLSVAMEARGFSAKGRGSRYCYRFKGRDYLAMAAGLVVMGGLVWWDRS